MLSQSIVVALSLCFTSPVAQAGPQQEQGGDEVRRQDRDGRRGGPTEAERQEWRARRDRYLKASPEERRRMRVERWVRMTSRTYELDESQETLVRSELEAMQADRRAEMGADAEEYDRLRDKMFELWAERDRENGDGDSGWRGMRRRMREDPEFQKLRERMREIDEKYPFDMRASVERIEKLLPEEKVKKGRARWESRRERWRQRSGDRRRDEDRRGRRDREGRARAEGREGAEGTGSSREAEARLKAAQEQAEQARKAEEQRQEKLAEEAAERLRKELEALHPWEKYAREFTKRYELTSAQANAATSIVKDLLARAAQIERVNAGKMAAAKQIKDPAARAARLAELNKPVEELFEELKKRLDGLLTASQRAKGKTQPSGGHGQSP